MPEDNIHCYGEDGVLGGVRGLYEGRGGNLWVGVQDGLWQWKPIQAKFYAEPVQEDIGIAALAESDDGALVFGSRTGIKRLVGGKIEAYSLPGIVQRFTARQLLRDGDGSLLERLNRARDLLRDVDQLSEVVEQLAQDCSISTRQAYRYLEQAQRLKRPIPLSEAKQAFTVKLPRSLVERVRTLAATKGLSISEGSAGRCSRCCREGEGVGEPKPIRQRALHLEYRFDRLLPDKLAHVYQLLGARAASANRRRNSESNESSLGSEP